MAGREEIYLKGKVKWCRPYSPDQYGKLGTRLYLDQENLNKFMELKVKNQIKKDDDGYSVSLSCPAVKLIKGIQKTFRVNVFDSKGLPMADTPIGDGSDVVCRLEKYQYNVPATKEKGNAIRLLAIRVDNLVPFDANEHLTATERVSAGQINEQPAQEDKW